MRVLKKVFPGDREDWEVDRKFGQDLGRRRERRKHKKTCHKAWKDGKQLEGQEREGQATRDEDSRINKA